SITNPADGAQFDQFALSVAGVAADDISVASVELRLNGGVWSNAIGTTNWTGSVNLISGTNTIEARSRDGAGNYSSVVLVNVSYSPPDTRLQQVITFGELSSQSVSDAPFPLAASASSGLPVTFTIMSGPATLTGNIVSITGPGLVIIRASQDGDSTYAPAA